MHLLRVISFYCAIFAFSAAAATPSLEFASTTQGQYTGCCALALPNGQTLLVGSIAAKAQLFSPGENAVLIPTVDIQLLDAAGVNISSTQLFWGSGSTSPTATAIDSNGNIWLVGFTDSDDFPLVNPISGSKGTNAYAGFVTQLDPTASHILFSSFLGDSTGGAFTIGGSAATGIAIDSTGNIFVTGTTAFGAFVASLPVLGTPSTADDVVTGYTFLTKISSAHQLVWSVLFGGIDGPCPDEYACTFSNANTSADAIAVDAADNITLGGSTNVSDLPPTVSAVALPGVPGETVALVVRIAADGKSLLWGTYLGSPQVTAGGIQTYALALDASANVFAAGVAFESFPITAGAFDSTFISDARHATNPALWAAEISSDGSTFKYGTYVTGVNGGRLGGIALDASGNLWITALNSLSTNPNIGTTFALELNPDGSAVIRQYGLALSSAVAPPSFDSAGNLLVFYPSGSLLRLNPIADSSTPSIYAITNAAKSMVDPGVTPGELATIWGPNIGPATASAGAPDSQGFFPVTLGGVQVMFQTTNGATVAAPLLYVGSDQINLQVPYEFNGGTMQIISPGQSILPISVPIIQSIGIFRSGGNTDSAAALNQDLSVNSVSNPAAKGSIAVLFATGLTGLSNPVTGALSTTAASFNGVLITDGDNLPLDILYAGPAPGLISGVYQINVQLPPGEIDPEITVTQSNLIQGTLLPLQSSATDTVEIYTQ